MGVCVCCLVCWCWRYKLYHLSVSTEKHDKMYESDSFTIIDGDASKKKQRISRTHSHTNFITWNWKRYMPSPISHIIYLRWIFMIYVMLFVAIFSWRKYGFEKKRMENFSKKKSSIAAATEPQKSRAIRVIYGVCVVVTSDFWTKSISGHCLWSKNDKRRTENKREIGQVTENIIKKIILDFRWTLSAGQASQASIEMFILYI